MDREKLIAGVKASRKHPRFLVDVAAVVLHLISVICVMALNTDFADETQGRILCAMEAITIISHIVYLSRYDGNYNEWQSLKWLEYAFSATLGVFAVAYVSDASVSINALVLLAAAGAAQQSQGYQLEYYMDNDPKFSWRDINIVLSFGVAAALQVAEFYVVGRIVNESPGVDSTDWLVFVSYIVGYGMFGLIMAIVILYKIGAEQAEVVYSGAGIFSKLAILFGDLAAYKKSLGGAIAVLLTLVVFNVILVVFGLLPHRRNYPSQDTANSNRF